MREFVVGQEVVVYKGSRSPYRGYDWNEPYAICKVTKVSKTQITLDDGNRYLINRGDMVGGGSYSPSLSFDFFDNNGGLMTVEKAIQRNLEWKIENAKRIMRSKVVNFDWKDVQKAPYEMIERVYDLIKEYENHD